MLRTVLALLTATTLQGLKVGTNQPKSCGGGNTFIDDALCDPDHLMSPEESQNIVHLLAKCGEEARHVKVMVFLAAHFTLNDNANPTNTAAATVTTTGDIRDSGDVSWGNDDGSTSINLLMESVVASNKLNSTFISSNTPSCIILLVAIKDPFQMTTWQSAATDGVLTRAALEETQRRAGTPMNLQHFTSAVVNVTLHLCESARTSRSMTLRDIILTIVWIAICASFGSLLIVIATTLIRARRRALNTIRAEASQQGGTHGTSVRRYPVTSTSEFQDFNVAYCRSTDHVLLGTTDITAVPAQGCSSTDNLLQA